MNSRLILGGISGLVWLLAWAAADDITTGHEPDFHQEYWMLFAAACWFAFVTAGLLRLRMLMLGVVSAVALLGAVWARGAIRPAGTPGPWPEYVASLGAFLWFGVLSLVLLGLGFVRRTRTGHA